MGTDRGYPQVFQEQKGVTPKCSLAVGFRLLAVLRARDVCESELSVVLAIPKSRHRLSVVKNCRQLRLSAVVRRVASKNHRQILRTPRFPQR